MIQALNYDVNTCLILIFMTFNLRIFQIKRMLDQFQPFKAVSCLKWKESFKNLFDGRQLDC